MPTNPVLQKRVIVLFILGTIFVLAPILFSYGWHRPFVDIPIIIGFWLFGEAASQFNNNQFSFRINWQSKYLSNNLALARMLVGIGALVMLLGTLLPWFQTIQPLYGFTSKPGFDTDGLFIGLAAIIPLGVAFLRKGIPGKPYSIFSMLWGVYNLYLLFDVYASLSTSVFIARDLGAKLGIGINVSFIGIILVIIGGVMDVYVKDE